MDFEMVGGLDQTNIVISSTLILILMVISRVRNVLNESGTVAAAVLGLGVAIGPLDMACNSTFILGWRVLGHPLALRRKTQARIP